MNKITYKKITYKILCFFFHISMAVVMSIGVAITWTAWGIGLRNAWAAVIASEMHGLQRVASLVGLGVVWVALFGSGVGMYAMIFTGHDFSIDKKDLKKKIKKLKKVLTDSR